MASKTREKLIESARQLFIRQGVENTTISDIANASDKGRRTIYTYFKNKKEIYRAVIERESDEMVKALRDIYESADSPTVKLQKFFERRFSMTKLATPPYSTIKSMLSLDFRRSELIRRKAYQKEAIMLYSILDEGIDSGDFDRDRCELMRKFLYRLIHAIDTLNIHDEFTPVDPENSEAFVAFLVKGVTK